MESRFQLLENVDCDEPVHTRAVEREDAEAVAPLAGVRTDGPERRRLVAEGAHDHVGSRGEIQADEEALATEGMVAEAIR